VCVCLGSVDFDHRRARRRTCLGALGCVAHPRAVDEGVVEDVVLVDESLGAEHALDARLDGRNGRRLEQELELGPRLRQRVRP
jgi:hypothetical protein